MWLYILLSFLFYIPVAVGAGLVPIIMCIVGMIPMLFFTIGRDLEEEISEFNVAARDGSLPKENEATKAD